MSLEVCPECTCRFAVGLLRCPQCQAPAPQFADRMKEEDDMPRITVAGGPSNPDAQPGETGYIAPPEPEEETSEVSPDAAALTEDKAAAEAPSRPAANASKADWKAYQIERGLAYVDASGMTKAELQEWEPTAEEVNSDEHGD